MPRRAGWLAGLALLWATGCAEEAAEPAWSDQLSPAGPCWEVNLGDGLDTEGADELHALYGCLNQDGAFAALAGVDAAMDASSREDRPLGAELGLLVEGMLDAELDVFGAAGVLLALLEDEDRPVEPALELVVELLYARPYPVIAGGGVTLASESALEQGVVAPLLPAVAEAAAALQDDGGDALALAEEALGSERLDEAVCTVVGLASSQEDDVETLRDRLADLLGDLDRQGELEEIPLWALHLASVDVNGEPLCDAETTRDCSSGDSALEALIRLLAEANTEVECSVLGLSIYEGNLAVDLLALLAGWESDTLEDANDLLGDVLGYSISGDLLDWVLGACDGMDDPAQLVDDLGSLDRLNDPEAGELLSVLVGALGALYDPDAGLDELEPLVEVITIVHDRELLPPTEEVLRDLASSALVSDLGLLVPLLLDPSPLAVDGCPTGASPLEFEDLWDLIGEALTKGERAEAPVATLQPVLNALLGQEGTWTALGNLAGLLGEDEATVREALPLVAEIVAADPDLELVAQLGPLLGDEALSGPLLRIAESRELMDAVGSTELSQEGPLPFGARLVTGGTVESLLRTLDLLLDTLGG